MDVFERMQVFSGHGLLAVACLFLLWSPASRAAANSSEFPTERPLTAQQLFAECEHPERYSSERRREQCEAWDAHLAYLERQLDQVCEDAGDKINQRVKHVAGFYINMDVPKRTSPFYKIRRTPDEFVMPILGRAYRFVEYGHGEKGVSRTEIESIGPGKYVATTKTKKTTLPAPTAEFEVTVKELLDRNSHLQGLYGDQVMVLDRESGDVIGSRTIFYYRHSRAARSFTGDRLNRPGKLRPGVRTLVPCANLKGSPAWGTLEQRMTPYYFIASVLVPMEYSTAERGAVYDLSVGGGAKSERCISQIRVGPNVSLENLTLRVKTLTFTDYRGVETPYETQVILGIRSRKDQLTCESYSRVHFIPRIFFADGSEANLDDLLVEAGHLEPRKKR